MAKMQKSFERVTFCEEYPTHDVADHEVLMEFVNNVDATLFRDWWFDEGAVQFAAWHAAAVRAGAVPPASKTKDGV